MPATSTFMVTIGDTNGKLIHGTSAEAFNTGGKVEPVIAGRITSGTAITIYEGGGTAPAVPTTITDNYERYTFVLAVCDTDNLCLTPTLVAPTGVSANSALVSAVADVAFAADSTMNDALNGLSGAALDKAFTTLAPVVSGGAVVGAVSAGGAAGATISTQVASLREGIAAGQGLNAGDGTANEERFWTQGFGSYAEQELRQKINGFTSATGGVAIGVDKRVQDNLLVGLAYSFAHTDVDTSLSQSNTKVASHQATLYGSFDIDQSVFQSDGVFLDGQLSYAFNDYDSERYIEVGAVTRRADGDFDGMQVSTKFDLGKTIQLDEGFRLTPSAGIGYTHVSVDNYTESNAGASSLKMNEQDYDILNLNVNAKFATTYQVEGSDFTPEVHFGYTYEAIHDKIITTSSFTGGGDSFKSTGFDTANSTGRAGAGFTYAGDTMPVDLTVTYDATVKADFVSHSGLIKGSWRF
jgi:outer membrane autotransporter protein